MSSIRLQFLGTGNAFNRDARASQAFLLGREDGPTILVDAGPTVGLSFEQYGVDSTAIDAVFITHLHGDHIAGWPFLVLRWVFIDARTRPLDVWGPAGVRERLEGLFELCYGDVTRSGRIAFETRWHELAIAEARGVRADDLGLTFDTLPVEHTGSSLAYRFVFDERSIAVTGDTRWCAAVETLAKDSDLLALECTTLEESDAMHVSLAEVRANVASLAACATVLVHLEDTVALALEETPIANVLVADDGMVIEL